jgi:HrpA-like RNA helicase
LDVCAAETSITVDDVTHVIDTGFVKEVRFDPASGISSLQEVVESRVAARQRAGTYKSSS